MRLKSVHWEITNRCNLSCKHCFVSKEVDKNIDLPFEEAISVISRLASFGVKKLTFSTKEPLLYKNLDKLIIECHRKGIATDMVTNGILLSDLEFAKKILNTPLVAIFISIEGITEESNDYIRGKGTFKKILQAIKNIKAISDKHLGIQMTLNEKNLKYVEEIPKFFNDMNIDSLNIGGISDQGNALDNKDIQLTDEEFSTAQEKVINAYNKLCKKNYQLNLKSALPIEVAYLNMKTGSNLFPQCPRCSILNNSYSVLSNGKVIPCISMLSSKVFKDKMFEIDIKNNYSLLDNTKFNNEVEAYINIKKGGICGECHFKEECFPCVLIYEEKDKKNITNRCEIATHKFERLLNSILEQDFLYNIVLNDNMIFTEVGDILHLKRFDLSNNSQEKKYKKKDIPIEIIELLYKKPKININDFKKLIVDSSKLKEVITKLVMDNIIRVERVE